MNSLVEQTVRFLSGSKPSIQEKSLSDAEIEDLLDKGEEVADAISKDSKKSEEERETAKDVLGWIEDVRKTWEKDNSLHPNAVNSLMRIVTGIHSGRYGWMNPDSPKVPQNYAREEDETLQEGMTSNVAKMTAIGLKKRSISLGN